MPPTRRTVLGATATTLALAGCLGDDDGGGADDATDTETEEANGETDTEADGTATEGGTAMDGGATVGVRSHPDHGDVLVGPDGLTLYMFDQDTQGEGASACYDGCAETWPPLTADDPTAGDGVTAELTTFEREDGSSQVAAGGWPLYYYAADEEPGDAAGQGVNDVWWVLDPDGTPVRPGNGESTETDDTTEADGGADSGDGTTESGPYRVA